MEYMTTRVGVGPVAVMIAQQAGKDQHLAETRFTGIDADLVDGRWNLWVAGRRVGAVEDTDLASRLRPVLRDMAAGRPAVGAEHDAPPVLEFDLAPEILHNRALRLVQ